MTRLIALSSSYGSLGSVIGPALAERLEVPLVDRAIPVAVAERLDCSVEHADADERRPNQGWLERMLVAFEYAPMAGPAPIPLAGTPDEFRIATEEVIRTQAARGEGVILGRAAVIVLGGDPSVLRVRLDGPEPARVRQAMQHFGISESAAVKQLRNVDGVRNDYARRLYGVDIRDPALYHLVVDSTALPVDAVVELIATAATALPAKP